MSKYKSRGIRLGVAVLFSLLCGYASDLVASEQYTSFEKWGIVFEYPKAWEEWSSDKSAYIKEAYRDEFKKDNITLLEITMITSQDESAALMISKSMRGNPITAGEVLKEREKVYENAKAAGDVTEVNQLGQTTVDNNPAVIEDVERSNGGRGRTVKVISGKTIFEISLIVRNKGNFANYQSEFEHLVKTFHIKM